MPNLIIGQSGGPTAVINSSLAGAFCAAKELGVEKIYGMKHGIKGFLRGDNVVLNEILDTEEKVELLKRTPASFLGSCRYKLPEISDDSEIYMQIFSRLQSMDVKYFLYVGGNDSMDTIKKLSDYAKLVNSDICFMGVPKTIDNDLALTDHSPGFGSCAKYIATAVRELVCDCRVYDVEAVTILEIMGRNAGWLTASAALARSEDCEGADLIYLPETVFDIDDFLKKVKDLAAKKHSVVVAISEGIKVADGRFVCELGDENAAVDAFGHKMMSGSGKYLENRIKQELKGIKCRSIELSTLQRCASHFASLTDINEAFLVGSEAVKAALNGETGKVVILKRESDSPYRCTTENMDVHGIANVEKTVPLKWITDGYVTEEAVNYIRPLIQGELTQFIENGVPKLIRL
ncbi:MAG: 6-phosphofructokinase [Treponema sp.]|nr:6-phosphofructokinase [Candidatus Treponema equifaecale]